MKTVETYRWRIKWGGRWTTTRHQATEAEILTNNPEAVRVEGSLVMRQIADTPEELQQAFALTCATHLGSAEI